MMMIIPVAAFTINMAGTMWGRMHLARAYTPGSIMPAHTYMFETKEKAEEDDTVVKLPPGYGPCGQMVVALPEALDLVKYMQGMDHTCPVLPPQLQPAAGTAAPAEAAPAAPVAQPAASGAAPAAS